MDGYKVVSKGVYVCPRTKDFPSVTSFIFARCDGKKYLLLKLDNPRAEAVGEVNIRISLLDRKGRVLNALRLSSDRGGEAGSSFAFGEKIEVPEECCDFSVKVESAVYGGYLYVNGKDGVTAEYEEYVKFDLDAVKTAMRGRTRTVTAKRIGAPVLAGVLTFLMLVCVALVTYFQLKDFMNNAVGFTYSGVEYVFEDSEKTPGSNITVTGYRGTGTNVRIPEKIDGYVVSAIRAGAFKGNGKIRRLKLECNAVIGKEAFAGCTALTSVEVTGEGEITPDVGAFGNCPGLKSVKIYKQINYSQSVSVFTGDRAIEELYLHNYDGENCGRIAWLFGVEMLSDSALKNLTVGKVREIGESFCYNFINLESVEIAYVDCETYGIGDYAFDRTNLKTFKFPQGLISVGEYAFSSTQLSDFNAPQLERIESYAFVSCSGLKNITLPESLKVISRGAFSGCQNLESAEFESEENLEYIGDYAFAYCENLRQAHIPDCVDFIGYQTFISCINMETLTVPYIGQDSAHGDNLNYLFGSEINLRSVTVTNAQSLARQAFYGCGTIKEINLNEGLEEIGDYAFSGCTGVKSIVIPASVTIAGYGIFDGCFRLYEVYNLSRAEIHCDYSLAEYSSLEQSVEKAAAYGYTAALSGGGFSKPAGWYLIDFPEENDLTLPQIIDGVTDYTVADYLFYCENITSVTLPETVAGIGECAFYGCGYLSEVNISDKAPLQEIRRAAFYGCASLKSFAMPVITEKIGDEAFGGCLQLKTVDFCNNVTDIGDYAFYGCDVLVEINIPNISAVTVGAGAFKGCSSVKRVDISGGVTGLGAEAFAGNFWLERVDISYVEGALGAEAFSDCSNLGEINVPMGTVRIEEYAFSGCRKLGKVTLPSSLEEIGDYAFYGCTKLRAVVNYSNLRIEKDENYGGVGYFAEFIVTSFTDAQNLTYTQADGITFLRFYNEWVAVWCDDGVTSLNLGASAADAETLRVGAYAFTENAKITYADLSGVYSVGKQAFCNCTALEKVAFDGNLMSLGEQAFMSCYELSSINLQDTALSHMGEETFFNCSALISAALPETLAEIPERAFYYCSSLADAVLPRSLTAVGDDAFYGCTALLQVHNLSSLSMRAGSIAHGHCAFYALHVFTDSQSKMTFAEKNGYKFANYGGNWYLYAYSGYEIYKNLPESFTFENSEISSYILRDDTFASGSYLIIPTSVTAIEKDGIGLPSTIFYRGTPTQWATVRPASLGGATVFYYSECIHSEGEKLWSFTVNGSPSTLPTELVWTETLKPTCTQNGERTGKCDKCGKTSTEVIEKLYHSCGPDGKCVICGEQGERAEGADGTYGSYSLTVKNFNFDGKTFKSSNTNYGSYATITLTAKEDMQVCFGCRTTSSSYDVLTVTAGGKTLAEVSSGYMQEFKTDLLKGQTITFSYYKSTYSYSGSGATVDYLLIFV